MIIYRPHRGRLHDAMAEAKEFDSIEDMKNHIVEDWRGYVSFEDIVLSDEVHEDNRVGWHDVHYVCTKRMGDRDYIAIYNCPQCIGMCSENYEK